MNNPVMNTNDFQNLNIQYNRFLKPLYKDITAMETTMKQFDLLYRIVGVVEYAKHYDIERALSVLEIPYQGKVERDFITPLFFTDMSVIGQVWADSVDKPLPPKDHWNRSNRGMNDRTQYELDENDLPRFPYMNFGINGQGILGRFGPNHAVDMGILRVMENGRGQKTLHVLGITREDDGKKALCGGFTVFDKEPNGRLRYGKKAMVNSQTMEFFEEMVSGSVTLLPEYENRIAKDVECKIAGLEVARKTAVDEAEKEVIRKQVIAHYKVKQVIEKDPEFLNRIRQEFDAATPCFAGCILASTRNTNNAWMETRLSWFEMDDAKWNRIKDDDKFGYDFVAGDDAGGVQWHEITPEILADTTAGHAALMTYLLASYAAKTVKEKRELSQDITRQVDEVLEYFVRQNTPQLQPIRHYVPQ